MFFFVMTGQIHTALTFVKASAGPILEEGAAVAVTIGRKVASNVHTFFLSFKHLEESEDRAGQAVLEASDNGAIKLASAYVVIASLLGVNSLVAKAGLHFAGVKSGIDFVLVALSLAFFEKVESSVADNYEPSETVLHDNRLSETIKLTIRDIRLAGKQAPLVSIISSVVCTIIGLVVSALTSVLITPIPLVSVVFNSLVDNLLLLGLASSTFTIFKSFISQLACLCGNHDYRFNICLVNVDESQPI